MQKPNFKVFKLEHYRESFTVRPKIPLLNRLVRYCIDEIHIDNGQLTFHGHVVIGTTAWLPAKNIKVDFMKAPLDEHVYAEVMQIRREQLTLAG